MKFSKNSAFKPYHPGIHSQFLIKKHKEEEEMMLMQSIKDRQIIIYDGKIVIYKLCKTRTLI